MDQDNKDQQQGANAAKPDFDPAQLAQRQINMQPIGQQGLDAAADAIKQGAQRLGGIDAPGAAGLAADAGQKGIQGLLDQVNQNQQQGPNAGQSDFDPAKLAQRQINMQPMGQQGLDAAADAIKKGAQRLGGIDAPGAAGLAVDAARKGIQGAGIDMDAALKATRGLGAQAGGGNALDAAKPDGIKIGDHRGKEIEPKTAEWKSATPTQLKDKQGAPEQAQEGAGKESVREALGKGNLGKSIGSQIGQAIAGETGAKVGAVVGQLATSIGSKLASEALDHSRGIGGGIGGAVGGVVGGVIDGDEGAKKGQQAGKSIGKAIGSAVGSVREQLASLGIETRAPGKEVKQSQGPKAK